MPHTLSTRKVALATNSDWTISYRALAPIDDETELWFSAAQVDEEKNKIALTASAKLRFVLINIRSSLTMPPDYQACCLAFVDADSRAFTTFYPPQNAV